jgi:predicted nuclease of predicted toxin-antitoxin system
VRILLDECLPRPLRRSLTGHDAITVQELGWSGVQNGALLRLAAAEGFGVFLTVDKSIEFQQSVADLGIAIIALRARSNDIVDLEPLIAEVLTVLPTIRPGTVIRVPAAAR